MEYLNPSPAASLPQPMWLIYRTVAARPRITQTELFDLSVPITMRASTPGSGNHFRSATDALIKLQLLTRTADNTLTAPSPLTPSEFLRELRHRIVQPATSFGTSFEGADDIRKGLIWLMRESPTKALNYNNDVATRTEVFVNYTRWNTFRIWCNALGFGQAALNLADDETTSGSIVPNPTNAVVDAILRPFHTPLPRREQVPIGRLIEFLRMELPVLPGHPSATFDALSDDIDDNALRVVGLALTAAEERGVLSMAYQSDPSGVMALPAKDGATRYVSNVTIAA